jgi:glycosyltransferase involved in cell wall biosynthesis
MSSTIKKAQDKKKKIVYLNSFPFKTLGGGEKHLMSLVKAAQGWGYDVHVICQRDSGLAKALKELGIKIIPMNVRSKNLCLTIFRLSRKLKQLKPDILHTHGFFCNVVGRLAGKLANVPAVVSTVHCEPDSTLTFDQSFRAQLLQKIRNRLDRFTARYADIIIAVAEVVREKLVRLSGISADKVVLIRNGVKVGGEEEIKSQLPQNRDEGWVVGSVGRLELVKGFDYFIEAAALVKKASLAKQVSFVLVGEGSQRPRLEKKVKSFGLERDFVFTGYRENSVEEIRGMDIFVAPSLSDTTNLAMLEAMSLGKPIVVTEVGGLPEVILDGQNGFLIRPRDAEALAEKIVFLIEHPNLALKVGAAGREHVKRKFSLSRMLEETKNIYTSLEKRKAQG